MKDFPETKVMAKEGDASSSIPDHMLRVPIPDGVTLHAAPIEKMAKDFSAEVQT